jgi:integrase
VLEMRRTDPTGQPSPPDAYGFGNGVGERLTSIKTAWRNTCRRGGIEDLHFHDLRREFVCRLLESSADLHDVRDCLGHAHITTTSRYLRSTPVRLAQALERMEAAAETRRRRG